MKNLILLMFLIFISCNEEKLGNKLSSFSICEQWTKEKFILSDSLSFKSFDKGLFRDVVYSEKKKSWEINTPFKVHNRDKIQYYNLYCQTRVALETEEYPYEIWEKISFNITNEE